MRKPAGLQSGPQQESATGRMPNAVAAGQTKIASGDSDPHGGGSPGFNVDSLKSDKLLQ